MKKDAAVKITPKKVMKALEEVMDPEIHISVVDLGLVYKVTVAKNKLHILMTLTSIGCPLFSLIETEVRNKMKTLGFKDSDIKLELTFDPPWSMERLSKRGRAVLGI
jgi:metal-sulfur cluster biosynthetic enzyme